MPRGKLSNRLQNQKTKQTKKKPLPPTKVAQQKFTHNSRGVLTTIRPIRDPHVITTITSLNPQFVSVHKYKSDGEDKIGSIYFPNGRIRLTHIGGPEIAFGVVKIGRYLIKRTATGREGQQELDNLKKAAASMFKGETPNEEIRPKIREVPSNLNSNLKDIQEFQNSEGRVALFEVFEKDNHKMKHLSRGGIALPQTKIYENAGIIERLIKLSFIIDMKVDDIYSPNSIISDAKGSFYNALNKKSDTTSNTLFQDTVSKLLTKIDSIFSWNEEDKRVVFIKIAQQYAALMNKQKNAQTWEQCIQLLCQRIYNKMMSLRK